MLRLVLLVIFRNTHMVLSKRKPQLPIAWLVQLRAAADSGDPVENISLQK